MMGILQTLHLRRPEIWERPTILDTLLLSPAGLLRYLVAFLYRFVLLPLRGAPFHPPWDKARIRVVCLSDTHDNILDPKKIPDGDLLIHCGDLTQDGTAQSIQKQIDWLSSLPHRHKVFVSGNHDSWFDPNARRAVDRVNGDGATTTTDGDRDHGGRGGSVEMRRGREGGRVSGNGTGKNHGGVGGVDFKGMHYLENSSITLEFKDGRKLNIYGSPALPECGDSSNAFQYSPQLHPWKNSVPDETDVLITHTPPKHHLDLSLGCPGLLSELWRVKPKLHVFGHVHWGHGREAVYYDECQRAYESLVSNPATDSLSPLQLQLLQHPPSKHSPPSPRNALPPKPKQKLFFPLSEFLFPILYVQEWLDVFRVVWHGINSIVWKWVMLGPGSNNGGLLVNAAVMYGNTGKAVNAVSVVDL